MSRIQKINFNPEALQAIPIEDVLELCGSEAKNRTYMTCPNNHDHKTYLKLYPSKNICKCHNCGEVQGGPVEIAKWKFEGDFKAACEWLHENFRIDYLHGDLTGNVQKRPKMVEKPIEYMKFDPKKKKIDVSLKEYIDDYKELDEGRRLKMIYTYVYRFSLNTSQEDKLAYFSKERGISADYKYLREIGTLSVDDVKVLVEKLKKIFPADDLVKLKLINDNDHKFFPNGFKYGSIKSTIFVVPSFDLYTNMVTGFILRPMVRPKWMVEQGTKELNISCPDVVWPLPYRMTRSLLLRDLPIVMAEGPVDGLSTELEEGNFIAIPGVNSWDEKIFGLLEGKVVYVLFDPDKPGQEGALKVAKALSKAGAIPVIKTWSVKIGDLNDLRKSGKLDELLQSLQLK